MSEGESEELVVLTSVTDPNLAQVMRLALEAEGITCRIEGGGQAGLSGVLPLRIFVPAEDLSRAREVLDVRTNRSMIERIKPMRIEIRKICVPTDFSEHADHALAYGLNIASRYGCEVHVLHVAEDAEDMADAKALAESSSPMFVTDFLDKLEAEAEAAELEAKLGEVGIVRAFRAGSPDDEICRYVEREQIDLVVIGTHGRTGLERLVMGSVAESLVRKCPCPVLSVRLRQPTEDDSD
jgi:nucleotide-binding universal stress UspA family protein